MNARFDDLEQAGRIERVPTRRIEVEHLHLAATRDLATAEDLRERSRDWALAIAYNAMQRACVALMAAHGYRARGEAQHWTGIEFARLALPDHANLLDRVDSLRRRRHQAVYGVVGQVSVIEVRDALDLAAHIIPQLRQAAEQAIKDRNT